MRTLPLLGLSMIGLTLLAGCDSLDPYKRAGNWQPLGVNESNLAMMVAVPSDLARGVDDDHLGNGQNVATAVARQQADKAYPLPSSGASAVQATGPGGTAQGDVGNAAGQAGSPAGGAQ